MNWINGSAVEWRARTSSSSSGQILWDSINLMSRVRNWVVRVREFAVVFPFTFPCPGRAEEWNQQNFTNPNYPISDSADEWVSEFPFSIGSGRTDRCLQFRGRGRHGASWPPRARGPTGYGYNWSVYWNSAYRVMWLKSKIDHIFTLILLLQYRCHNIR